MDANTGDTKIDKESQQQQQQLTRKQASAVGATASAVRGLLLQPLYLWYRTPLKLFRPLRVDYLATARALLPQEILSRKISFQGSSIGMIANAVKQRGWSFLPRYVIQPMLANWIVGFTLFTTYTATLPAAYARASSQYSFNSKEALPAAPPFIAGAIAGASQSIVATPLDSLRIRFEVEDMVSGKYHSWWGFVRDQISIEGLRGLYRGLRLTMIKDTAGYAGFFGLFELIKNETIDLYSDLVHVACSADFFSSDEDIRRLTRDRVKELRQLIDNDPDRFPNHAWVIRSPFVVLPVLFLPPILAKPSCMLVAGAVAALAYQAVDYPLEQFRARLYSEVASDEVFKDAVSKHFPYGATYLNEKPNILRNGRSIAAMTPYRVAWRSLKDVAVREYPRPATSELFKAYLAVRYLYRGWFGVALRSIPAASLGLVAYEMLKNSL